MQKRNQVWLGSCLTVPHHRTPRLGEPRGGWKDTPGLPRTAGFGRRRQPSRRAAPRPGESSPPPNTCLPTPSPAAHSAPARPGGHRRQRLQPALPGRGKALPRGMEASPALMCGLWVKHAPKRGLDPSGGSTRVPDLPPPPRPQPDCLMFPKMSRGPFRSPPPARLTPSFPPLFPCLCSSHNLTATNLFYLFFKKTSGKPFEVWSLEVSHPQGF